MADVTYNVDMFPALLRTLGGLLKLPPSDYISVTALEPFNTSTTRRPLVLLAYKERHPAERSLFELARKQLGIDFQPVGNVPGVGGCCIEIYIG